VVQRTCGHAPRPRRQRRPLVRVLGYQLFIVMAATGYLLGVTQAANMPSRNGMSICG
jgi:cbb3-type cytochrome oxidase subunit 1